MGFRARSDLGRGLGLGWLVLHAVAWAFDDDGLAVVEEAVEDGGGDGAVVVED